MKSKSRKQYLLAALALIAIVVGWYTLSPRLQSLPVVDRYGCQPPEPSVFTSVGLDASVASAAYSNLAIGQIDVKTDPAAVDLLSVASRDSTVRGYLRCLAIERDGFNAEQATYLDQLNAFMSTSPNPDQFSSWQASNPFPRVVQIVEKTVTACSHLRVVAEWSGTSARERSESCTYNAPDGCVIVAAEKDVHSDNNGSSSVDILAKGQSLKAKVKARPHGSVVDRRRGWMEISVKASLRCEE